MANALARLLEQKLRRVILDLTTLAFPGIFRGALNVRSRRINEAMKLAAAHALASCIKSNELSPEYIVPSVSNQDVVRNVTAAVEQATIKTHVARKGSLGDKQLAVSPGIAPGTGVMNDQ